MAPQFQSRQHAINYYRKSLFNLMEGRNGGFDLSEKKLAEAKELFRLWLHNMKLLLQEQEE